MYSLSLWNVGINEKSFQYILGAVLFSNVRTLSFDYSPLPPSKDMLFSYLLHEDVSPKTIHFNLKKNPRTNLINQQSPIKVLSLKSNNITTEGLKSLATRLKSNQTLRSLNLSGNKFSREAAEYFAQALKFNQSLISLSLAKTGLGDEGVKALTKVLAFTPVTQEEKRSRQVFAEEADKIRKESEDVGNFL